MQTPYGKVTLQGIYRPSSDQCQNCGELATQDMTATNLTADGGFGHCSTLRRSCDDCALTVAVDALRGLTCVLAMTDPTDVIDPDVALDGVAFFLSDALAAPAVCCQCNGPAQERLRVYHYPRYLERPICVPCTHSAIAQLYEEVHRQLLADHMVGLELSDSDSDSDCE